MILCARHEYDVVVLRDKFLFTLNRECSCVQNINIMLRLIIYIQQQKSVKITFYHGRKQYIITTSNGLKQTFPPFMQINPIFIKLFVPCVIVYLKR